MNLKPFLHQHHLLYANYFEKQEDCCDKCNLQIHGWAFTREICNFWLHKPCAVQQLPLEISHPLHSQHPLKLVQERSRDDGERFFCNGCASLTLSCLYRCRVCNFNLDHICASSSATITSHSCKEITHFCHHHPLRGFEYRKVSKHHYCCFWCEELLSGISYGCFRCGTELFVHETCLINMPTTISKHHFHQSHLLHLNPHTRHELVLTDVFVEDFSYQYCCDICEQERKPRHPVYCCKECKFVAHIGCAINKTKDDGNFEKGSTSSLVDGKASIGKLMEKDGQANFSTHLEIKYCTGRHLLILNEAIGKHESSATCNACSIEITDEAYACKRCKYYIHKTCTRLPFEVLHPLHPQHPLKWSPGSVYVSETFTCEECRDKAYGFRYVCYACDFKLDVKCAISWVPKNETQRLKDMEILSKLCIFNQAALTVTMNFMKAVLDFHGKCSSNFIRCTPFILSLTHQKLVVPATKKRNVENAEESFPGFLSVSAWNVIPSCILERVLPRSLKSKYHMHPITLEFGLKEEDSREYYCDICEDERDPRGHVYHCMECRGQFVAHVGCALNSGEETETASNLVLDSCPAEPQKQDETDDDNATCLIM
ncbi:hypothetical protein V6N13_050711 [Hibiscus sabdariffa]